MRTYQEHSAFARPESGVGFRSKMPACNRSATLFRFGSSLFAGRKFPVIGLGNLERKVSHFCGMPGFPKRQIGLEICKFPVDSLKTGNSGKRLVRSRLRRAPSLSCKSDEAVRRQRSLRHAKEAAVPAVGGPTALHCPLFPSRA